MQFKSLAIVQLGLSLLACAHLAFAQEADFRDASWGMTRSDVIALHPGEIPADRRIGAIAYDGKLAALDVLIFYRFNERGELYQAGYEVDTRDIDPAEIIEHYNKLSRLLRRKYPQSAEAQQVWRNRLFEDEPDEWGQAVRSGHLSYRWNHTLPRTRIEHSLTKGRRELVHTLSYETVVEESSQDVLEQL